MIGVIVPPEEEELAREFFELFKTPWEFYQAEGQYDVVLIAGDSVDPSDVAANLVVVYAGHELPFDRGDRMSIISRRNNGMLIYEGSQLPVYGDFLAFEGLGRSVISISGEHSEYSVGALYESGSRTMLRIGYDLFQELRVLLTAGQPANNAHIPTLEVHIAILRDCIVGAGILLVEIPPIPEGYAFVACLTHDVDHPAIRLHKFDHTMFGFLYRAVIRSFLRFVRGRVPLRDCLTNWAAAAKLPFVHLDLARDFWCEFDRYVDMERELDSTFFVLPYRDRPGKTVSGLAPPIRASVYGPADIVERLQTLVSAGREIGLHGIDAWIDAEKGLEERAQIERIGIAREIGVRMHWLYYDDRSAATLERAGFRYDSTVGYNETVGYRAGTTQVYKPLQAHHLLELPLHVMDTALFYPGYLDLTFEEATKRIGEFIGDAHQFGGVITFNWHDRSIAPERLWGEFYASLLLELKRKGAWCGSAGSVVSWFQGRRSVVFRQAGRRLEITRMGSALDIERDVPGLRLRIYNFRTGCDNSAECYSDLSVKRHMTVCVDDCGVASYN